MPPVSKVVMPPKSVYLFSEIFFNKLKNPFSSHKFPGKVLLKLDGLVSHLNDDETFEFAMMHDV